MIELIDVHRMRIGEKCDIRHVVIIKGAIGRALVKSDECGDVGERENGAIDKDDRKVQ
jgi:hypothetical protein